MPVYVADWFGSQSIMLMSLEEEGGYFRLLLQAWASGDCTLPDDDQSLSVLSRLGQKWFEGSGDKIRRCFKTRKSAAGPRLFNEKQLGLWKERRDHAEKCRLAGIKSGVSRRSGTNDRSTDVGTETPTKPRTKTNSSSSFSSSSSSSRSILDAWLAKVKPETLRDIGLLLDWIKAAAVAGAVENSDFCRDRIVAVAMRCVARGQKGGAGLFTKMMRDGSYHHATIDEFAAAVAAVQEHLNANVGPVDSEVQALLASMLERMNPP